MTQQILYLENYEFFGHLFPIDHLHLTPSNNSLISVSSDGMIFILNIKSKKEEPEANPNNRIIVN